MELSKMYRLYDFLPSGNGYKVRLLLSQLKIPFHWIEVDILREETRKFEFLTKNPNGRIPVLEISPNQYLAESNAILYHLSQNTSYFPSDSWYSAQVMQWLFFEQYSHEPYIATSRYWLTILNQPEEYQRELEKKKQGGYHALKIMEAHLQTRSFFVNEQYTIADIALYAYTHVAEEGGFNLQSFPSILSWLNRIEQKPDYIPITYRF
ncbi:glutathione S-transferase family protein [Geminocystis sp. NIES-3709]|uniref:glutathione S-transferase family protein n=1 Tax=Geminocystis sp. NIES-3709 TaxID=1617448 RepID=UPI0005FC57FC|nr:glutathione S-transferase family protein [Geminocystis sp. NIES-3709]BAQ63973.1 glutathione S-transferase [Geminocystis sp. NIES-3709]